MSYSLDEALREHTKVAQSLKTALEKYPTAHHVEGRIWEVYRLEEADDVLVTKDGVWPCVWIGTNTSGWRGHAICIRERKYSLNPEQFLRSLASESPEWRAKLLKMARGQS